MQSFGRKEGRRTTSGRAAPNVPFQFRSSLPHFALLSPLRVVNAAAAAKRRLSIEIAALKAPFTAPPALLTLNGRNSQSKDNPYSLLVSVPIVVLVRSDNSSQIAMLESS